MADKADWEYGGFGLYLHWPFCQAKCPYCDFNSHVVSNIDQEVWKAAYIQEIRRAAQETEGRILNSVFFGGGTPSMMDADLVEAILTEIRANWPLANDIEITLEANPTSVEAARFEGYRVAGVNRVSMGIQALNDPDLRALGRLHSASEALDAFAIARDTFQRVSFDLIYARQNQSEESWENELAQALALRPDHLSLYQLTIEDGTAFGDRYAVGKLKGLPDEDRSVRLFEITQSMCEQAGLPGYEVSNHAKPGQESRHNLIYWRYGDYIGIGPGAHGRLTLGDNRLATECIKEPFGWLKAVRNGSGELERSRLSAEDQCSEFLLMGLRVREGVLLDRLDFHSHGSFNNNIKYLEEIDLLETKPPYLRLTTDGRPLLNAVLAKLMET